MKKTKKIKRIDSFRKNIVKKLHNNRHYIYTLFTSLVLAVFIIASINKEPFFNLTKQNLKLVFFNFCTLMLLTVIGELFKAIIRTTPIVTNSFFKKLLYKLPLIFTALFFIAFYSISLVEISKLQDNNTLTVFLTTMSFLIVTCVFTGFQERVEEEQDDNFVESTKKFYFAALRKRIKSQKQHEKRTHDRTKRFRDGDY